MARANVTPLASAIISGDEDLTVWADEDLLRGRRGRRGRPPKVVPTAILQELTRRRFLKAEEVVKSSLVSAVELWKQIVEDETAPHPIRLRASELIVDRCWGKATERIDARVDIKEPAWMAIVRRAVSIDGTPIGDRPDVRSAMGVIPVPEEDIVDAEVISESSVSDQCQRQNHAGCHLGCECGCHLAPESDDDPILYDDREDDVVWDD